MRLNWIEYGVWLNRHDHECTWFLMEMIENRIIYSYANQHYFNHANGEDRYFKEFSNFIYMKERRGSLKSCGSIKSSLSCLVEEKYAFKASCSHD